MEDKKEDHDREIGIGAQSLEADSRRGARRELRCVGRYNVSEWATKIKKARNKSRVGAPTTVIYKPDRVAARFAIDQKPGEPESERFIKIGFDRFAEIH